METIMQQQSIKQDVLAVVPLRGKVAFPHVNTIFEVGRTITLKAVEYASERAGKLVFVCTQKTTNKEDITSDDLYTVGTVCQIRQFTRLPSGTTRVQVKGLFPARVKAFTFNGEYFYAAVEELPITLGNEGYTDAYLETAKKLVSDIFSGEASMQKELAAKLNAAEDANEYVDILTSSLNRVKLEAKQTMLEETDPLKRISMLVDFLKEELEIAKLERKIASSVKASVDKSQKEYFLREQLKAIHTELGDSGKEEDAYREKIKAKNLPKEVEEKCLKEVDRMSRMQQSSPEYTVSIGYI